MKAKLITIFLFCLLIITNFWVFKLLPLEAAETVNLINNQSVETPTNYNKKLPLYWYQNRWGINRAAFTYPVTGYDSSRGLKVELTTRITGDAKWYFKEVPVTPEKEYAYSDYYISNTKSYIVARIKNKRNRYITVELAALEPASTWTRIEAFYITPKDAVSMTIYHLIRSKGMLTTDNFSLGLRPPYSTPSNPPANPPSDPQPTSGSNPTSAPAPTSTPVPTATPTVVPTEIPTPTPTPTAVPTEIPTPTPTPTEIPTPTATPTETPQGENLILNPGFEDLDSTGSAPQYWATGNWGTNTAIFTYPETSGDSSKGAKTEITSYSDGDGKWYFQDVNVNPNTVYKFSDSYMSNVTTQLIMRFTSTSDVISYKELAPVVPSATWTTTEEIFITPSDVKSMTIFHLINVVGFLSVDNFSLTKQGSGVAFTQGMVSLDFDDGWATTFANAIPILNAAGFYSTQYIVTTFLGIPEYITATQMLQMQAQGHDIESHSRTHDHLPLLTAELLLNEVQGSKNELIALGTNPISLSYPYGEYNTTVIEAVKTAGYLGARTAITQDSGYNYKNTDNYLLKTFSVEVDTSLDQVKTWINTAVATKSWVILVFHQVDNGGGQYSVTPAFLQEVVNYLTQNNISVVTVRQGLQLKSQ